MYITEWLRQRGRFGFDEWHSNSYFPIDIAPLLNVYDFAIGEDHKLRQMAGAVLDYLFFILAADTYQGIFCEVGAFNAAGVGYASSDPVIGRPTPIGARNTTRDPRYRVARRARVSTTSRVVTKR